MTEHAIAANAAALRNLAARLERLGYQGDCHTEAEHIAVNLLLDGYRKLEPPPPLRPARVADDNSPGRVAFRAAREALGQREKAGR